MDISSIQYMQGRPPGGSIVSPDVIVKTALLKGDLLALLLLSWTCYSLELRRDGSNSYIESRVATCLLGEWCKLNAKIVRQISNVYKKIFEKVIIIPLNPLYDNKTNHLLWFFFCFYLEGVILVVLSAHWDVQPSFYDAWERGGWSEQGAADGCWVALTRHHPAWLAGCWSPSAGLFDSRDRRALGPRHILLSDVDLLIPISSMCVLTTKPILLVNWISLLSLFCKHKTAMLHPTARCISCLSSSFFHSLVSVLFCWMMPS